MDNRRVEDVLDALASFRKFSHGSKFKATRTVTHLLRLVVSTVVADILKFTWASQIVLDEIRTFHF